MKSFRIPNRKHHPVVEGDFTTQYYHKPLLRYFYLRRLKKAFEFIHESKFERVLDIGFGSGVFFPQLSTLSQELYGVDINPNIPEVKSMLELENISVALYKSSVLSLPFQDESFDCVVSISMLEHIHKLDIAVYEIWRVLKKGGCAVLGYPVQNKLTDFLLIAAGSEHDHGQPLREVHPNSHQDILGVLKKIFRTDLQIKHMPALLPLDLSLYCWSYCKKK